uniref:Uncharacterized protein n=1 Tax=Monopterus albus TaxID=43700 RepID=A0A3Q3JRU7_MONAL
MTVCCLHMCSECSAVQRRTLATRGCVCVLLCLSVCVCLNLLHEAVMFSGPRGSLFGFSVDFHTVDNK